jgi:hypothetical protein
MTVPNFTSINAATTMSRPPVSRHRQSRPAFASVRAITIRDHRAQSSCISNEVRRVRRLAELDHVECLLPDISGRFPSCGDTVVSADAVTHAPRHSDAKIFSAFVTASSVFSRI